MDNDPVGIAVRLIAVLLLVLANGFFVATEFALVSVRRTRIEQLSAEGSRAARTVRRALNHLDQYIAATQLGITMASLALGWIGEPALAALIEPPLAVVLPHDLALISSHTIGTVIAFILITALHIVLGELAPKSIALQRPEPTALAVGGPITLFNTVFRPAVSLLNGTGNLVIRLFGLKPEAGGHGTIYSEEELKLVVHASAQGGALLPQEERLINRVFQFADRQAHEVMVPRTAVVGIAETATLDDLLEAVRAEHHSRFPVYRGDLDHIIGVLHTKDILRQLDFSKGRPPESFDLRRLMRPVVTVPFTLTIDKLLQELRRRRGSMAVVVDEYGGTAGLVTIEDIVEEIVGDLPDEFEPQETEVETLPDGSRLFSGLLPITTVNERFGLELSDPYYDTIAGFMLSQLGRKPEVGDAVAVDGHRLEVVELDGLRIARIRLEKAKE